MAHQIAEKFIEALRNLEQNRDVEQISALYADNAEINNAVTVDSPTKLDPKRFWTSYRETFGEMESVFRNKIYGENTAVLEWSTVGTNTDGSEIAYEGVSILETDGDKIIRFFAYFNPNKLGRQITEEAAKSQEAR